MTFKNQKDPDWQLVKVDPSEQETLYRSPITGESWIEYYPLNHDRCSLQFRIEPLPEIKSLISSCLQSQHEFDWQGLAHHLSGNAATSDVARELAATLSIREVKPRALEVFRRYYSPVFQNNDCRKSYLEIDKLTSQKK